MVSIMNGSTVSEIHTNGAHTIVIYLNGVHTDKSNVSHSFSNVPSTNGLHSERPLTNGSKHCEFYTPNSNPPPTRFAAKCHPRADEVCTELDAFFSEHWPWENERARVKFLAADTNRWACWALPLAKDDRILDSVKVNTLLFLLDGKLLHTLCLQRVRLRPR